MCTQNVLHTTPQYMYTACTCTCACILHNVHCTMYIVHAGCLPDTLHEIHAACIMYSTLHSLVTSLVRLGWQPSSQIISALCCIVPCYLVVRGDCKASRAPELLYVWQKSRGLDMIGMLIIWLECYCWCYSDREMIDSQTNGLFYCIV